MSLQRKHIKNLLQGVSQQPHTLRFDEQCEEQINFLSDPTKGLVKRPGTEFICTLNEDQVGNNNPDSTPFSFLGQPVPSPFIHHIRRSDQEELLLVLHNDRIALFNASTGAPINIYDGPDKNNLVQFDEAASGFIDDYLKFNTADYQKKLPFEAVSISDYTFILNKAITVDSLSDTDGKGEKINGFVFIREGEFACEYVVRITDTEGLERVVTVKTADSGTAGADKDYKTSNIIAAIHWGLASSTTIANLKFTTSNAPLYATENTEIRVTTTQDTGYNYADFDFYRNVGDPALFFHMDASPASYQLPTIAVSDSFGNSITNGGINETDNFDGLPLSCMNNFHLKITGSPSSDYDDYYIRFTTNDSSLGNTDIAAGKWAEAEARNSTDYEVGTIVGGASNVSDAETVIITDNQGNSVTFEFDDDASVTGGNVSVTIGADITETISNLKTAITAQITAANLVLEAVHDNDTKTITITEKAFGIGNGITTTASNVTVSDFSNELRRYFNTETMPHVLVRIDATNYWYGPLDSGAGTAASVADKDDGRSSWSPRSAGDSLTNPFPSFAGQKINDLVYFKSRLGFCSGENIVFSELNQPFNFFRTTVLQTLATDEIDITTSVNEITELNYAVPFANQLIVFSGSSQFIVTYGNEGLNPQTAALSLITRYDASSLAKPVALDNSIIFARKKGSSTDIMELYPTGATNTSFEARNLTAHIPSYIDRDVIKIVPSSLAQAILLHTEGTLDSSNEPDPIIFVYKYMDSGAERVQSCWSKYDMHKSVSHILDIHKIDEEYRLVTMVPCSWETTNISGGGVTRSYRNVYVSLRMDNTVSNEWSLDDTVTDSQCTFTGTHTLSGETLGYDAVNDWTLIQVPYGVPGAGSSQVTTDSYAPVIVDNNGVTGTIIDSPMSGAARYDIIKVDGDWTGKDSFTFGSSVLSEYTFSDQYLKRQDITGKPMAVVDGRTTVRWVEVYFSNTQYMKLSATYPSQNRDDTYKTFSGTITGGAVIGQQTSETGTLRMFVGARNNVPTIKLTSSTHQKAVTTGASFSLNYDNRERSRR